jgi:DNA modification methylase
VTASVHYSDDAVTLWHGDARQVSEFIPAESVDVLCTSPPYYSLRSYTDGGEHYDGQMGSEATPREFVDNLIAATADWVKVLKPTGSIWVNLGDKYAGSGGHNNNGLGGSTLGHHKGGGGPHAERMQTVQATRRQAPDRYNQASDGIPAKSLMGLPWRYANRVVDELGLILRECIIWQKPNGLPESVTDRCRVSHEYLFHFTRQGRYFAAMDEIREPHTGGAHGSPGRIGKEWISGEGVKHRFVAGDPSEYNKLGKLPGSVWSIPSEPLVVPDHLGVDHFAAFPSELPRRIILGWSPKAYCTVCDEPRRAVKDIDWGKVPHTMVERRVLSDADRREWSKLFGEWWSASGLTRAEMVPHFPHYKNGDSVTAQMSNWHRGKNIPGEADWSILCGTVGDPPPRLDDLVTSLSLVPVADWETPDAVIAGRHKTKKATLDSGDYSTITGYACACPTNDAPTRPAVVLDPFLGTGTTAAVAKALGRNAHGVDLSRDYLRLAEWRVNDPGIARKVLERSGVRVPKPPVIDGQLDLLDGAA